MNGYRWTNCPEEVKAQVQAVHDYLMHALGDNLLGIYVHGSLCLGSFQPGRSDLDLLIIAHSQLSAAERFELMNGFLALHRKPTPLELSILALDDLHPWRHPAPYQFHFSEYWRERYEQTAANKDMSFWAFREAPTDGDLACHVRLTRQSGIRICGPEVQAIMPEVPEEDFWDSIVWGVEYYSGLEGDQLATGILSLLRIWCY